MTVPRSRRPASARRFGRRGGAGRCATAPSGSPPGRVCALVGPNGAGKSTLLALAAGLLAPTEGALTVLGTHPAAARDRIAYVAQDKPLYPQLTVAETLRLGHELNPGRWDAAVAERIVASGALTQDARVRTLSGGQRTRVALALALGKRPELLLLDEPMADLDPLARHELMGVLMAEAAEHGTTVVMSSHIVAELEGSCDYLLLVGGGRVRLGGGPGRSARRAHPGHRPGAPRPRPAHRRRVPHDGASAHRARTAAGPRRRPAGQTTEPSLEELVLAHLRTPDAPPLLTPSASGGTDNGVAEAVASA